MFIRYLKKLLGIKPTKQFVSELKGINGYVEITVRDEDGNVIFEDSDKNLVLTAGKEDIMNILRDDNAGKQTSGTVRSIARFSIGDGGAPSNSLFTPNALDPARTTLFNEVRRVEITSHSKPTGNSIEVVVDINSNTTVIGDYNPANNGAFVNEAAMWLSVSGTFTEGHPSSPGVTDPSEVMLVHKAFKSFPFDPGLNITATFKWTIFIVL